MKSTVWFLSALLALIAGGCGGVSPEKPAAARERSLLTAVAATPPMGWNSFDAYDCRINEEQYRKSVDWLAENLKPYGWNYAVIDYIWFNPAPGAWKNPKRRFGHPDVRLDKNGVPIDQLAMDKWGRLLPAVERFPSAANGQGFKPLADYVHSKGMRFGIHIMRGIPRQAYYENTPIKGSRYTAKDIANPSDQCSWCNNMFGVDPTKPGAQDYYNSIFELYASWGVDFIKADDMLVPAYHAGEIEMMRKAIDHAGRPMVLSLSPGEAPISRARHLRKNANMWRISADFWDDWPALRHNFDLLYAWSPWITPHTWPDADMLPIGHISLDGRPHGPDRQSRFTWPEHYTLMTLDCIARSPLMWGGDPLSSSPKSVSFLQNREVLAVNQDSENNRRIYHRHGFAAWMAEVPGTRDHYLALFNLNEKKARASFNFEWEMLRGRFLVRDLWAHRDLGEFEGEFGAELDPHGAGLYRLSPR